MRRWIHSLIVALLCLTLFVDTAKACWFLRHHRRGQTCRPVACRPACPSPCCVPCEPAGTACDHVVVEHRAATPADEVVESTVTDAAAATEAIDAPVALQQHAPAAAKESVVEHGPTLVVGPKPAADAPAKAAESVVVAPAAEQPAPIAAPTAAPTNAPAPLEQAAPAVPEAEGLAAREPLPDLKPAQPAGPTMIAPASNAEPVAEPASSLASQAKTAEPRGDAEDAGGPPPAVAEQPIPAKSAPADDLAGGPEAKPAARAPQEPNLFDLYGDDEGDADAPVGEEADDAEEPEMFEEDAAEADAGESDDESAEADTAAEETEETKAEPDADEEAEEMAEEDADEEASAEPADPETEDDADAGAEQPEDKPADTEADPFAASFAVPDEPMRRWTDDTGTRHAQGWLVELHADRVRILKANGRHTTVPLESLSAADRDYVTAVGARLAAERNGQSPAATATAGL